MEASSIPFPQLKLLGLKNHGKKKQYDGDGGRHKIEVGSERGRISLILPVKISTIYVVINNLMQIYDSPNYHKVPFINLKVEMLP